MNSFRENRNKLLTEKKRSFDEILNKKDGFILNEKDFTCDKKVNMSGIANLGNTCYMNAILQCLLHTKELINYFEDYSDDFRKNKLDISESFYNLLDIYYGKKDKEFINPEHFRNSLIKKHKQFDNKDQHDSHELLTCILDNLMTESDEREFSYSNNTDKENFSKPLQRMFYGKLNSTIKCLKCNENNTSITETFSTLVLSIPIEFKLFVYFIPMIPGPATKMFIKITDNMYFYSLIKIISNNLNYEIKSCIFYSVLNYEMKKIFDQKTVVFEILNNNFFLFVIENEIEIKEKRIFFSCGFYSYDEDIISELNYFEDLSYFKVVSYPRVFLFQQNEKINNIFTYLSNYCENYIEKNDYNILVKSNRNMILKRFECVFCNKFKSIVFYCGCIKTFNIQKNNLLIKIVNNKFFFEGVSIEIYMISKKKRYKIKELNSCNDITNKPITETNIDLYQLMNFFTQEEILEDKILCNQCGNHELCTKKIEFEIFPKVFMINLKRFRFQTNSINRSIKKKDKLIYNSTEKNSYLIQFPIDDMDISKYSKISNEKYELFAVCYHHGNINSGHYTSVCRIGEKWFEFNDKIIREYDCEKIVNSDAYILFYQQKTNGKEENLHNLFKI